MTNFQKWLKLTQHLPSPQNYVEWTWRSVVASCLQRRVWIGWDTQQLFSNLYNILVGPPGTGKGLILKEASFLLRYHKLKDVKPSDKLSEDQKAVAEMVNRDDLKKAQGDTQQSNNKKVSIADALLIPMAADCTTYEAFVQFVDDAYRRVNYTEFDLKTGKDELRVYGHSSICFVLQELSSLLRKRTDDTVNFLLGLYDCPLDYEYKTKTQGEDRVRRGCLNILAGTTPSFMQSVFDDGLLDEGMSSRTFFIFAKKPRFYKMFLPKPTDEQLACREDLLAHVKKLTQLYGNVEVEQETIDWLENWWRNFNENELDSKPQKLLPYFARKNIHAMKVAMCNHFSESTEMKISLQEFQQAIRDLDEEEKTMQYAVITESTNPVAKLIDKMLPFFRSGPKDMVEIICEFTSMANRSQLEEGLNILVETGQLDIDRETNPHTEKERIVWKLKK